MKVLIFDSGNEDDDFDFRQAEQIGDEETLLKNANRIYPNIQSFQNAINDEEEQAFFEQCVYFLKEENEK